MREVKRKFGSSFLLGLVWVLGACSTVDDGEIEEAGEAIVNGTIDTTHPATVWVLSRGALISGGYLTFSTCSGTIIKADASTGTGLVLTARHCVPSGGAPIEIRQGTDIDYRTPGLISYSATGWNPFPGQHDLALIPFSGATAATPVMRLNPSAPKPGDTATLVGYGRTPAATNTKRNRIDVQVQDSARDIYTSSPSGAACFGDSGGSLLTKYEGEDRLSGVISSVSGSDCGPGDLTSSVNVLSSDVVPWLLSAGVPMPPTCTVSVSPSSGLVSTVYKATWSTTGNPTSCTYKLDDRPVASAPCSGSEFPLPALPLGAHTVTLHASGANGSSSCAATYNVLPPAPTCTATVSPSTGVASTVFKVTNWNTVGNVTSCKYRVDDGPLISAACSGKDFVLPSLPPDPMNALVYSVTLYPTGPGGTSSCTARWMIMPAPPTCSISLSPTTGKLSTNTTITASWNTIRPHRCLYRVNSGPYTAGAYTDFDCKNGSLPISAAFLGTGTHVIEVRAIGNGGVTECTSNTVTISP